MTSPTEQAQAKAQRLLQFSILVCGKTGIGKSSLVNFILGEEVCEVGDPGASVGSGFECMTKEVEGYVVNMNGIMVVIYDSPGLQDGTNNDKEYLADMYSKCRNVNLVFYCHDMPSPRWTDHEVNAMHLLTDKFGPTFWDKAVFVLTKANMIQLTKPGTEEEKREHFRNWTSNSAKKFRDELLKQLQREAQPAEADEIQQRVDSIPVVPTGSEAVQILPNGQHFIGDLWVNCLERITDPHLTEIFAQATNTPERLITCEEIEREGQSFGVTQDGIKTASSITEYVAPLREYLAQTVPKPKPTSTKQFTPAPSIQLSAKQPTTGSKAECNVQFQPQHASGAQVQQNITYYVTHEQSSPPDLESLALVPKPSPAQEEPSQQGPKFVIIINNVQAERIKKRS